MRARSQSAHFAALADPREVIVAALVNPVSSVIAIIIYCVLLVTVATGVLLLIDRLRQAIWSHRNPPTKLAEARHAFEERLLRPDWLFYERHLQRPVPAALRDLYADHSLIVSSFQYDDLHYLSSFEPLDEPALVDSRRWLGFDAVPFANSDGDSIYLRPGATEPDTVFITYHDGSETEELAPDVSTFFERARNANRSA